MERHGIRFNPEKASKLLDPKRKEQMPTEHILSLFDLKQGDIVADCGAGNGFFTIPIAKVTKAPVYAVDIEMKMLDYLREHAEEEEVENIKYVPADLAKTSLPDHSVEKIFTAFVMHEVPDLKAVLDEFKRIVKPDGTILAIDWETVESGGGPPLQEKLSSTDLQETFESNGFQVEKHMISEAVYALIIKQ